MEDGGGPGCSSWSHLPPTYLKTDIISPQGIDITTSKAVVKAVEELSNQLCQYHSFALTIGTNVDGIHLRQNLLRRQNKVCESLLSSTALLSDAFRRVAALPRKEVAELERSCRVLVACVHTLDRELRRTMYLYHIFPLAPDVDGEKKTYFIQTGCTDRCDEALITFHCSPAESYIKERDSWQELERTVLKVHDVDVFLMRDEILGPVLDYLTLCPMGDIPGSKVSLDDTSDLPEGYCDEETLFHKRSNLVCYIGAIVLVACVGVGVLIAVIFISMQ